MLRPTEGGYHIIQYILFVKLLLWETLAKTSPTIELCYIHEYV